MSNILWIIVSETSFYATDPFKFNLFDDFCNSEPSDTQFQPKIRTIKVVGDYWSKNVHKIKKFYQDICLLFSHKLTSYAS